MRSLGAITVVPASALVLATGACEPCHPLVRTPRAGASSTSTTFAVVWNHGTSMHEVRVPRCSPDDADCGPQPGRRFHGCYRPLAPRHVTGAGVVAYRCTYDYDKTGVVRGIQQCHAVGGEAVTDECRHGGECLVRNSHEKMKSFPECKHDGECVVTDRDCESFREDLYATNWSSARDWPTDELLCGCVHGRCSFFSQ